ncbi:CBS domain-containing protein [Alteribacillus iranensis]|uniref:CBS domain-containing protein n=2 Tax=Alteribacillus iranensis TaxID=930128 RepID=A0A1I2C078_9BACI|nr:CBS domain-containing protein [Alteribacillus iranensis]
MEAEIKKYEQAIQNHPIFSGVSAAEFGALMEQCRLKNYKQSQNVWYAGSPRNGLLLMLEGVTEVYVAINGQSSSHEVLEVLEAGDVVGFSSLADFLGEPAPFDHPYTVEVQAVEESVCLHIPYSVMEARWHQEEVRDYMLRQVSVRLRDIYASLAEQVHLAHQWGESDPFIQRVQDVMNTPVVTVSENTPVREVAAKMVDHHASSVVVEDTDQNIVGIITEKDLVQRVLSSGTGSDVTASAVMTSHPYLIQTQSYYYEAMSRFLLNGVKHLPVVTPENENRVVGMVTLSDLLRKRNRGRFEILQQIETTTGDTLPEMKHAIYDVLAHLISDRIPTLHLLEIITKLYDRLVRRCVEMAETEVVTKHGPPPVRYAFFLMGSGGRAEQFMLTDQDHFLVFEDPESDEDREKAESYFRALGHEIVYWLERAGYKRCDGNMMASEGAWRGSTSQWGDRLRTWGLRATNQNILLGHNFLAFRFLYGDQSVRDTFVETVHTQLESSTIFLYRAAEQEKNAPIPMLDHPVRAIFRLKKEGIDIKKHALFPFHHSLQILAAKHGIFGGTPLEKIDSLQEISVIDEAFADDLRFAYEVALKIRVEQSWSRYERGEGSTSEIKFSQIKSRDKEELMQAMKIFRTLQSQAVSAFGLRT